MNQKRESKQTITLEIPFSGVIVLVLRTRYVMRNFGRLRPGKGATTDIVVPLFLHDIFVAIPNDVTTG